MGRFADIVTSHPITVLLVLALVTALAASRIVDPATGELLLRIDPSIDGLLPSGDPDREDYERVRRLFGSDETILIALEADDVFATESLERIGRMTERLEREPDVHHVQSIVNALELRGEPGGIFLAPFMEELPESEAERLALRRALLDSRLYAGSLVARDATVTLLLVFLRDRSERELLAGGVIDAIDGVVAAERARVGDPARIQVTGGLYAKAENTRLMLEDLRRTMPLAILVAVAVAGVSFRSIRGVVAPAISVILPVVWTLATMSLIGTPLDLMTIILPTLLLVVGFAYSIHFIAEYYDVLEGGGEVVADAGSASRLALQNVGLPVILTGATTAAGFLALTTSGIRVIQLFGLYSALGIVFTVVSTLTFAPALLTLLPERIPSRSGRAGERFDRAVSALTLFNIQRRGHILLAGAVIFALSLYAATRIEVSTQFIEPGSALQRAAALLDEHMEGSGALYVVLESDQDGGFVDPLDLKELSELQHWLIERPEVGGASSLVDYVMLLNQAFNEGDAAAFVIPESRRLVSQLLFFGASDELERLVDSRRRTTAIHVRTSVADTSAMAALVRAIEVRLEQLPGRLRGRVTGNTVLVTRTLDDLARGQAVSLGIAFAMILAVLSLLFTSLRAGLVALVPNALPVMLYFGLLGASGVTLNTTTGLVACLVLGIAVDDSIHYLARWSAAARRRADETVAVHEALRSVIRPVSYTSLALCLGFLTLTTSHFQNQVQFGVLAAATLAFAWLVDVTFTPAIASRMRIVGLWDILTLDLGEAPNRSIPIFRGMSAYQARLTAVFFRIVEFPKGHVLCRAGDAGDHMYVVIDGCVHAYLDTDHGRVDFGTMERGAAVGEVALFHGSRTATVVAQTDVRLLRFSRRDLARLSKRHPRTANFLYANLSQVLADHVASTTEHVR